MDDPSKTVILHLDDSAPPLQNLLRQTLTAHNVFQFVVTSSPRKKLKLGSMRLQNKLRFSPNLQHVATADSSDRKCWKLRRET